MPELPEVEVFRKYFEKTSLNKEITGVDILDKKTLKDVNPLYFQTKLVGNKFKSSSRYGKYLLCFISAKEAVIMHFGMTGYLTYYKNIQDASTHIRIAFNFSDNSHLGFDCRRRFGKITYSDDYTSFISEKELGIDPINSKLHFKDFLNLVDGKTSNIKVFLMDQNIMAGIGNVYSDEILFHTNLSPKRNISSLKDEELKLLHKNIKKILSDSIKYAEKDQFPGDYLLHYRKEGKDCPRCSGKIKFSTIGGRSSYYCNKHQK